MALLSMTGFGRASAQLGGREYVCEIRTVNHRYLDVRIKVPRSLALAELPIKRLVTDGLDRGRVEVSIQGVGFEDGLSTEIAIDRNLAQAVRDAHQHLADEFSLPVKVDTRTLASYPGVLRSCATEVPETAQVDFTRELVASAIGQLIEMRSTEGLKLGEVLANHLGVLRDFCETVAEAAPSVAKRYRERLENRISEVLGDRGLEIDESRILHEVAVFAEKADVMEEVARLRAHYDHLDRLIHLDDGEAVGRRMDFLCQEILREANTIGSKAQSIDLTECVVGMKAELERLREQVQNVE
jgi:uncharacterized protein (TIGR00255 family)